MDEENRTNLRTDAAQRYRPPGERRLRTRRLPPPARPAESEYEVVHHPHLFGLRAQGEGSLESRVKAFGLEDKIGQVLIPTEAITEVRGGRKYTSERMFYPGYVLVEMDLTGFRSGGEGDHVWHVVKSTPRVTGFVGTANDPTPLSDEEVNHIVLPRGRRQGEAEAQGQVREERTGAHHRGAVCDLHGSGRRGE